MTKHVREYDRSTCGRSIAHVCRVPSGNAITPHPADAVPEVDACAEREQPESVRPIKIPRHERREFLDCLRTRVGRLDERRNAQYPDPCKVGPERRGHGRPARASENAKLDLRPRVPERIDLTLLLRSRRP